LVIVVRNNKQILEILASEWHGVPDEARHRLEPRVLELANEWGVTHDCAVYDQAGLGRSSGSYLAKHGFAGAIGTGKGGKLYGNRRTANALAMRRRLGPNRTS
jgi:hypothetical protein